MSSSLLHVALQEGFEGDRVTVVVDGSRFEFDALSTRLQIGLAEEVEVELEVGPVEVRVTIPERGVDAVTSSELTDETWLGVNCRDDTIEFTWSRSPFFYA